MATFLRTNSSSSLSSIGSDNTEFVGKSLKGTQDQIKNKNIVQRTRDALGDIGNRLKKNPVAFGGKAAPLLKKDVTGAGTKEFAVPSNRPPRVALKAKPKAVEKSSVKPAGTSKNEVHPDPLAPSLKSFKSDVATDGASEVLGTITEKIRAQDTDKDNGKAVAAVVKEDHILIPVSDDETADKENEYNPKLSTEAVQTDAFSCNRLNVIADIDKDEKNPLLVQVYIQDIFNYVFALEKKYPVRIRYLEGRLINSRMRGVLLDWLVEVHLQFSFLPETLYMAAKILDRYLQADRSVTRKQLQLVGVTAMYIAAKYEEVCTPAVQDFAAVSDNAFSVADVIKMEHSMLTTLSFDLAFPPAVLFLRRFSKAASATMAIHSMAKYIMELSIVDYAACHLLPSEQAAGSLALALMILDDRKLVDVWNPTIQHYSRYSFESIKPTVSLLAGVLARAQEETNKLKAVYKKYTAKRLNHTSTASELVTGHWKHRILQEVCKV